MQKFLDFYFELATPEDIKLEVNSDATEIKRRVVKAFGQPSQPILPRWKLKTPEEYQCAIDLIMEGYPWPQPESDPTDPILLSFSFHLEWKLSVFRTVEWLDVYATDERFRRTVMLIDLGNRSFATTDFPFPLSSKDPASYDFLKRFSQNAPFKMNPKHVRVMEFGPNGKLSSKRPDEIVAARLTEAVSQP